ncbi:MAG: glycosyltransferase family 39 protein [Anaerolineae bacterium]
MAVGEAAPSGLWRLRNSLPWRLQVAAEGPAGRRRPDHSPSAPASGSHPLPFPGWGGKGVGGIGEVLWGLGAILLLGLVLRLTQLTFQPLWWDEGYSLYFATLPLAEMVRQTAVDIHPPLYYALLHGWMALAGSGPAAVRTFSVLTGLAAVPLAFALGRRLGGRPAGWAAGVVVALSPFHLFYSQEVRMYALVTTLGLGACLLHWDLLRSFEKGGHGRRTWLWAGYALLTTAALYTQYYAVFLVLAQAAYTLLWAWRRAGRWAFTRWVLGAQALAIGLFLPWAAYAGPKLWLYVRYKVGQDADLPAGPLVYLARHLAAMGSGHWEGSLASWWWLGLIPVGLTAWGLWGEARRQDRGPWAYLGLWLAVPLIGGFLVNLVAPFAPVRGERLLLLAAPALWLLMGWALAVAWERARPFFWAAGLATLAVWALTLWGFYTVPRYPTEDYRGLVGRVAALDTPDDAVICVFPWQVGYFRAYHPHPFPHLVLTPSQIVPQAVQHWQEDPARRQQDLAALLAKHPRVWLPAYLASGSSLEREMAQDLESLGYWALSEWYGTTNLLLFGSEPGGMTAIPSPASRPGDAVVLEGGTVRADEVETGRGILALTLTWRPLRPVSQGTRLVFRLRDETGHVWAQWDREPAFGLDPFAGWRVGQSRTVRMGLLLPAGLPPGPYPITVALSAEDAGWDLGTVLLKAPERPLPPDAFPVQTPRPSDLALPGRPAPAIHLLGYSRTEGPVETGWPLTLTLFWQGLDDVLRQTAPAIVFLQGLDEAGRVHFAEEVQPGRGRFPTDHWQPGTLCLDPHRLTIPADLPSGTYRLIAGLLDSATGERWAVVGGEGRGQDHLDLGMVTVVGRSHNFTPPMTQHPASALFGGLIRLVGYDLDDAEARPGGYLSLTLHWQAVETPARSLAVFVHLADGEGNIVAQDDGIPAEGRLPVTGWLPGEHVSDPHDIAIPEGAPPGEYRLLVGWYDPEGMGRLPVEGGEVVGGDSLLLVRVTLIP